MNQSLNNLEINVYQLVQKFETLVSENRRLNEEIDRLKLEQEQQKTPNTTRPLTNSAKPCWFKSANSKKTCKAKLTT